MRILLSLILLMLPSISSASTLNGSDLSLFWGIPFAGILLSIAILPILAKTLWHHHFGKIIAGWTLIFLLLFIISFGIKEALYLLSHSILTEYIPFIILLLSLYTISGGILIWGNLNGTPLLNTTILIIGTFFASIMGTTGAAMLLIRPLLRANEQRKYKVHVVIFFIFLVANIGGGLTPLGDPPLFLGFLKGVDFIWTFTHILIPVLIVSTVLLVIFFIIDSYLYNKEKKLNINLNNKNINHSNEKFKIYGIYNLGLLLLIIMSVLLSGIYKNIYSFNILESNIELTNILRDIFLLILIGISLYITPKQVRTGNEFNFAPIIEVAKLFIGIFITIVPVIMILQSYNGCADGIGCSNPLDGALAILFTDGNINNLMFFWITGMLSGFLDNAPTYLVFFNLAGGDANILMNHLPETLIAISSGAVFMGALTYIGNAPNFMVKAIAEQRGIKMPSFFGYMLWSVLILIPLFILLSLILF